jgi:hypothetical protein
VAGQPLQGDLRTYLSRLAITHNSANTVSFVTGVLLVIVYGWMVWRSGRASAPRWAFPAGLAGILYGSYLLLSVTLVKTYPSTYWRNPLPLSDTVVAQGRQGYMAVCSECHGETGAGDGPWSVENRGRIPDLASPHMDVHTDGEIYWWISHGIPELDMPALDAELNQHERWAVINFVRSLRHGVNNP